MIKSGFFNSVNGDRVYNADDFNKFFEGIVTDGVFRGFGGELNVLSNGGMSVSVLSGKAVSLGHYILNTDTITLDIDAGDSQPRYDGVVASIDTDNRVGAIYVVKGTPSSNPKPPTLARTSTHKELLLAIVKVSANASTITEITDARPQKSVCGWVRLTNPQDDMVVRRTSNVSAMDRVIELPVGSVDEGTPDDNVLVFKNGLLLPNTEYTVNKTYGKVTLKNVPSESDKFTAMVFSAVERI